MKPLLKITLLWTALCVLAPKLACGAPLINTNILLTDQLPTDPVYDQTKTNQAVKPSTPIFSDTSGMCAHAFPVTAPDGHQITLAEWTKARGTAQVQCVAGGTQVTLHLTGLIPKGVYTIWVGVFTSPGMTPNFANYIAEGALGAPNGSQNKIVAGSDGSADLSVLHPFGQLGEGFGPSLNCLLDEFEFILAGAYHPDGKTHGVYPGVDASDWATRSICHPDCRLE